MKVNILIYVVRHFQLSLISQTRARLLMERFIFWKGEVLVHWRGYRGLCTGREMYSAWEGYECCML